MPGMGNVARRPNSYMALPEIIEVGPWHPHARTEVTVPGSKSITNRALVLAALAEGETTLRGALWSEDTQVMVECLQDLGFMVNVAPEPDELCNRAITVYGRGGEVPRGGTRENPMELFVGNAGTAARFLSALVCLGQGVYRLHGVPRMHERPQAALFGALRQLGYTIDSPNDRLPVLIHGAGPRAGKCRVSIEDSSQFASALLLGARIGGWKIEVTGENAEESPYVAMTIKLISALRGAGTSRIEPDCSSGSYFWAAGLSVAHWPCSAWQIDERFPKFLPLPEKISRRDDLGDSIMTAVVMAPFGKQAVLFTDLERLRVQECERVFALRTELTKCGARVEEQGNTLRVFPSSLHGAEIETYNDHRMAMCFAIVGLKVPGIKIRNPACVKKTFPNFFQKLAAIGVPILDAGRPVPAEDLIA
jgi:3-phosphoshikimate 1-carboxyvinyltransferase